MTFKDILDELEITPSQEDNQVEHWKNRHSRFPRINTKQCPQLIYGALTIILGDLHWVYKEDNGHPIFHNAWIGETHPGIKKSNNRGVRCIDKGEVSNLSRQFGFSMMDIERKIRREIRQLYFLERAVVAFPEKANIVEVLKDHRDSILCYDYLLEEYQKYKHLNDEILKLKAEPEAESESASSESISSPSPTIETIESSPDSIESTSSLLVSPEVAPEIESEDSSESEEESITIESIEPGTFLSLPIPVTHQEIEEITAALKQAQEQKIEALSAFISLANDLDVSFSYIRVLAKKMSYLSQSPRGAKTTPTQRKEIIQQFDEKLLGDDYSYTSYWEMVYTIALKYQIWPKSVEKMIQEKCGFNRPERPNVSIRCRPEKKLFPQLFNAVIKEQLAKEESAKEQHTIETTLPAEEVKKEGTEMPSDLEFNVVSKERKIIEKTLSLDLPKVLKLLSLANIKVPDNARLTFQNEILSISWME